MNVILDENYAWKSRILPQPDDRSSVSDMSTLTEIEAAVATLPDAQKEKLFKSLAVRLEGGTIDEPVFLG